MPGVELPSDYSVAVVTIDLIVECGAAGELDKALLEGPRVSALQDGDPGDRYSPIERAYEHRSERPAVSPGWWQLVTVVLDQMKSHVSEHPYEVSQGSYF